MRFLPAPANENLFGAELAGGASTEGSADWSDGSVLLARFGFCGGLN